jgi:CubicO group peptidase (beta-lactamase class C family)
VPADCLEPLLAQGSLSADQQSKVDAAVHDVLTKTGVPSASVGIVQGGQVVFTKAYGSARLDPPMNATTSHRYAIGSISKQFTAACVLLLQEEGKLSIDDPVAKYFPELTRARDVTIRNILSHTSGYEDYAPQDYTIPAWTRPTTADKVVHEWATKPLDFEPGSQYQYSNTNFNIAGLIVEKVSGEPFWSYLSRRVLKPLGMTQTIDLDSEHDKLEPVGYMRNALGPLRPAIMEAAGWYFADGEMAMPVGDLLIWDISLMNRSLLSPASYTAMETDQRLTTGQTARYGLGVSLSVRNGHRVVAHGGEVGGFVAQNAGFPDDKIAIACSPIRKPVRRPAESPGRSRCSSCPHPTPVPALRQRLLRLRHKPGEFSPDCKKVRSIEHCSRPTAIFTSIRPRSTITPGVSGRSAPSRRLHRPPHRCVAA